jgi:hypothetical protein
MAITSVSSADQLSEAHRPRRHIEDHVPYPIGGPRGHRLTEGRGHAQARGGLGGADEHQFLASRHEARAQMGCRDQKVVPRTGESFLVKPAIEPEGVSGRERRGVVGELGREPQLALRRRGSPRPFFVVRKAHRHPPLV